MGASQLWLPIASFPALASLDRPSLRLLSLPSPSHRTFKRFPSSPDLHTAVQHLHAHSARLHMACLAVRLSDCFDRYGLHSHSGGIGCCLSAAASLLGLLRCLSSAGPSETGSTLLYFYSLKSLRQNNTLIAACQSSEESPPSDNHAIEKDLVLDANANPMSTSMSTNEMNESRMSRKTDLATCSNLEGTGSKTLYAGIEEQSQFGVLEDKSAEGDSPIGRFYSPHSPSPTSQRKWSGSTSTDGKLSTQLNENYQTWEAVSDQEQLCEDPSLRSNVSVESAPIALKEPIYQVLEVKSDGSVVTKSVSRRQILKSSGLRLRDIRSVDPSLWVTNSMPALLIRDQAILLNLGSLRAIATPKNVLIFDHKSIGAEAFLDLLLPRLNPETNSGVPTMPFELEVVEASLLSRTQRLERRLMEIEPRVLSLLKVLPNCLTADVLEELRVSKQALVELGSKAGALRQMLLELLESPQEIRRMTIMGRRCTIRKEDGSIVCTASVDKQLADDEEEEIEMLLENYLQRCESCHGQAERFLDSAKEMEDSIAVNLSSRRLEVSRLELLLQVGTFCSALGALVAGIFGMNLRSYLEGSMISFWLTTAGIILGGTILFFVMYNYLKKRKIL